MALFADIGSAYNPLLKVGTYQYALVARPLL